MDLGKTFDRLIKLIGGLTTTSELCDIREYGVWRWRSEGIPPKHWGKIVKSTNGAITFDELDTFKAAATRAMAAKAKEKERGRGSTG